MTVWVVGFDLSLTAPAAVALPLDWRPGDWKRVRAWCLRTTQPKPGDLEGQLKRYDEIATWALTHVVRTLPGVEGPYSGGVIGGYVEDYGYHQGMVAGIKESGGIVKHVLFKAHKIVLQPVTSSEARKLTLGFNPRRPKHDPKVVVQDTVCNKFGAPTSWTEDVCDAFLVAQWGMADRDGKFLTLSTPEKTGRSDTTRVNPDKALSRLYGGNPRQR